MNSGLTYTVITHPRLGALSLEEIIGEGGTSRIARARDVEGDAYAIKLGRVAPFPGPGRASACVDLAPEGPKAEPLALSAAVIDGALRAEARQLEAAGEWYRVGSYGLGEWHDEELDRTRPALILEEISGRSLDSFSQEDWLEESWPIIADLMSMIDVTTGGENAPHRDLKPSNVFVGQNNLVHLIDPGVVFTRAEVTEWNAIPSDDLGWPDDAPITVTTFEAYPAVAPGKPGADLMAIGLMIYQGIAGQPPFDRDECPAPKSYNFGFGRYSRGAKRPTDIIGAIPPLSEVAQGVTPEMDHLVSALLGAPLNRDFALKQGPPLEEWVMMCHAAAESVR